ncbi:unnamed protein product [Psylliodes chrysocephalus]|uniref:C2H2-type domain-containing protein n=1 Tax=Psylliodes chrysocephalus TaxID=3402493 RepID=A0A9P0D8U6_9CUCU|nr:unnamed protein product [Psylliodes chrysocephala]
MEVRQDPFDPHKGLFKIEPDRVFVRPEGTHVCEIKQEIIECIEPKMEQWSDLPVKIEDTSDVRGVIGTDLLVVKSVKQEFSYHVPFKIESDLLTSHCDLPTLKEESTVYPDDFEQSCSSKLVEAERITKSLKSAVKYVHNKKKSGYTCPVCLKSFPCSKSKLKHILGKFGNCSAKISDRSPFWRGNQSNGSFANFYQDCFCCGRFFPNRLLFLDHFIIYHYVKYLQTKSPSKCKYRLKAFETILDEYTKKYTVKKLFKCEICSKNFYRKSSLIRHLIVHTYKCEICFKSFNSTECMKSQLKEKEKPFRCEICTKQFREKSYLKELIKNRNGEKPLRCEICSKRFNQIYHLNVHIERHTRKKLFNCKICSKQFIWKCQLNKHLKIHTEEKRLKCKICSKQFKHTCNLNVHLKRHSEEKPFCCKICLIRFYQKYELKRHLITHTGEKPYMCAVCSKRFCRKSNLNRHLIIHTEEKPFRCEKCSKQFKLKYYLKKHLKIHTG